MSKQVNVGHEGVDGTQTKHKGDSQQSHQKGAPSVSNKKTGKHLKDHSGGEDNEGVEKKQPNSI
jgi:hypothetical protein